MPHEIIPQRDWFVVKTSGATMLRIRPTPVDFSEIPDPIATFKSELAKLENMDAAELENPALLEARAVAYFHTGKLEEALNDFNALNRMTQDKRNYVLEQITLTLARLGRADEAKASLAKYLQTETNVSSKLYVKIQVPAWLGDFPEASRRLESAIKTASSDPESDSFDYDLYNLARAGCMCSGYGR